MGMTESITRRCWLLWLCRWRGRWRCGRGRWNCRWRKPRSWKQGIIKENHSMVVHFLLPCIFDISIGFVAYSNQDITNCHMCHHTQLYFFYHNAINLIWKILLVGCMIVPYDEAQKSVRLSKFPSIWREVTLPCSSIGANFLLRQGLSEWTNGQSYLYI